jgi:hypothetical protein
MDFNEKARSINEVMPIVIGMLNLQREGRDTMRPCLVGDPGIGKSTISRQIMKENDYNFMVIQLALTMLEEMTGIPEFQITTYGDGEVKGTRFTLPEMVTEIYKLSQCGRDGDNLKTTVVMFDDAHLYNQTHWAMFQELFSEHTIRGYELPQNVAFMLARNYSNKAGSKTIPSTIVNRIAQIPVKMEFDVWKKWAFRNTVNSKIVAYLGTPTGQKHFIQEEQVNNPYATPRSWTRLSTLLNEMEKYMTLSQADVTYWSSTHVGDEAGADFSGYWHVYSAIQADKIFDGKLEIEIPKELANKYIMTIACTNEYIHRFVNKIGNPTPVYVNIVSKLLDVMPEIAISGIKDLSIYSFETKVKCLDKVLNSLNDNHKKLVYESVNTLI